MLNTLTAITTCAIVCFVGDDAAKSATTLKPAEINAKAVTWTEANAKDKIVKNADLVAAIVKANTERANWGAYTADWENWNPEQAEKHKDSFAYAEWQYSSKKDKALRASLTTGAAADALRALVKDSGGVITRAYAVDVKGCNVAADVPTTDYFQGDEGKWTEVEKTKKVCAGEEPYRDKSTGVFAAQISIPVFNDKSELIGAVMIVIPADKLK